MSDPDLRTAPDAVSRRDFVKAVGVAALVSAAPMALGAARASARAVAPVAGPSPSAASETAVARFYASLKDDQRKLLCFPFDDPLRSKVQNNWAIVKPTIGDLTGDQKALCREIFKNLLSDEGHERFQKQMDGDAGGFKTYHVAVFGEPGTDKPFEWVLTGRHVTVRADGNSVEGAAFGGPIFYGHDATGTGNDDKASTPDNVWWYQGRAGQQAIFATLDDKQQARALAPKSEPDAPRSIEAQGRAGRRPRPACAVGRPRRPAEGDGPASSSRT